MKASVITLAVIITVHTLSFCLSRPIQVEKPLKRQSVEIAVIYTSTKGHDTLDMFYYDNPLDLGDLSYNSKLEKCIHLESRPQNGTYKFKFKPTSNYGYFIIAKRDTSVAGNKTLPISKPYQVQYGDRINIMIDERVYIANCASCINFYHHFSGSSAKKYKIQEQIDTAMDNAKGPAIINQDGYFNPGNKCDVKLKAGLKVLENSRKELDKRQFFLLKADILASYYNTNKYRYLDRFYNEHYSAMDTIQRKRFIKTYDSLMTAEQQISIPQDILYHSGRYASLLYMEIRGKATVHMGGVNMSKTFEYLKGGSDSELKDKVWLIFLEDLMSNYTIVSDYNSMVNYAIGHMGKYGLNSLQLNQLENRMNGTIAFNFSLKNTEGKIIHLSDFKGKVILIDFWFTGCGGCHHFYQDILSNVEKHFKSNSKIKFIAVSADKGFDFWKKSVASGDYTSPDAINLYTNGQALSNPVIEHYNIKSFPSPMIIDKNGRITIFKDDVMSSKEKLISGLDRVLAAQ